MIGEDLWIEFGNSKWCCRRRRKGKKKKKKKRNGVEDMKKERDREKEKEGEGEHGQVKYCTGQTDI